MQPGLQRLSPPARHLTPVAPGSRHQREKLAVFSRFASQALVQAPGFDCMPALRTLALQASIEHPELMAWDGSTLTCHALGVSLGPDGLEDLKSGAFGLGDEIGRCLTQLPAEWRLAGLLSLAFAEDFAVVRSGDATVPWMAVALPSSWAPELKVGHHFAHIHGPVADADRLRASGQALMRLVVSGDAWERWVWTVTAHSRLHAHPERLDPKGWQPTLESSEPLATRAWWRTERQTFLAVPGYDQAVFTIRVDLQPLTQVIHSPQRARRLHAALASMSPAVLDYRGLTAVRETLLSWLESLG